MLPFKTNISSAYFALRIALLVSVASFILFAFGLQQAQASVTDGTIDATYRYAWGENIGWVDFGSTTDTVHITDAAVTGSVYGENIGWIVLDPVGYGGVTNDGEGNLAGYAWGENIGWVDFSQVVINEAGYFTGQAYGENIGWITFGTTTDNKVLTDWRPVSARVTISGTLYSDEGVAPITSGKTIKLVIGTTTIATDTTTSNGSGVFSFSTSSTNIATSTPLLLFVDEDGTTRAALVTKATSSVSNITGLDLYQDHVIAKSGVGTTTNASDFFFYDSNDDSDVQFTASSSLGRLTIADGQTLYVASSTTFHIDTPLVGHSFETATTGVAIASSSIALSGNYHNAGTLQTATTSATIWTSRTSAANNSWRSVTYGNGLFVAVAYSGTGNRVMTSPDGITWTSRTSAANNSWRSVTYGNGLFVAVAAFTVGNGVMTSPDGITWTSRTSAADNEWRSVTYGNGLFVAVSSDGTGNRVQTSPDGITWTSRTSAADNSWSSVTYGNGLFVAVSYTGTGNRVMTSPDGITWTSRTSAADNSWYSVTYGSGLFVAVSTSGTGNRVQTSPDGITWTSRTSAADNSWFSVTYGNGLFVAVSSDGTGNRVMTSSELPYLSFSGTTAQSLSGTMTATSSLPNVVFSESGTKTFIATASTSAFIIATSSGTVNAPDTLSISGDFANSSSFTAPTAFIFDGAGNQTATGTWSGTSNLTLTGSGQKIFTTNASTTDVAVNSGAELVAPPTLSIDGDYTNNGTSSSIATHWTSRTSAANNSWYSVTYGSGLFVAVSSDGTGNRVQTSPDGITWTSRTSAANNSWRSVTYGNGLFVAVSTSGTGNRVMTSSDGITWTSRTSAANNSWFSVTYGNGLFVAVSYTGTGNRVMTSPDGITWTSRTSAADNSWYSVTYGNGLFVAVSYTGTGNRVQTSPDGITWTSRTSAADNSWSSVTYGSGLFVAVSTSGTGNRVMTSPDGITWTSRTSAADNSWYSVTYGSGLFVAVSSDGTGNRVMTSPDGITWTLRTSAANNSWRSVTYGNGLFVAVSYTGTGNRVMTSAPSTVVFGGASAQNVAGNLTGASAFGNVTISNTSGTGSSSQSVTFADPVAVNGTLTMLASTSAAFPAGATTTIAQVDWRGTSVSPVWLRSTESGSQWYLDITQEQLAVEYVNVKDSNATSSQTGTVVAINSIDSGNNENWLFNESIGSSTIANADASQVDNAFSFQNKTDEALFAFKLTPESGVATVTEVAFAVSGAQKIATDNFSNLRLYRDHNSDAAYDAGDEQVGGVGVFTLTDRRGAITFTDDFAATTSQNYVLVADWNAPENGSFMTIDLLPNDLEIIDALGVHEVFGEVSHVQHHRNNRGGGGGMRAAIGGEDIPPGRSEETGGGQNGGGTVDGGTGELIGDDPNFRNPAAHSGAWQDADRAYDRTDGTYATTDSANAASFYNHGFGVPETNQITGIEAKLEISGSTAAGDIGVQLSWDGGNSWTDARTTPTLTVNDKVVVFGGASDVWGRSWSADNFSNANFMIRLTGNPSANTIRVDALQVRVYHQATGGEQGGGGAI